MQEISTSQAIQAIPKPSQSHPKALQIPGASPQSLVRRAAAESVGHRTSSRCRRQGVGLEVGPDEGSGGLKYVNQEICHSVKCKMAENHRKYG